MRLDGCVLCRIYKTERTQRKKKGRNDDGGGGGGGEEQPPPPPPADDQSTELSSVFVDTDAPTLYSFLGTINNDANNSSTNSNNIVDNNDDNYNNNNDIGGGSVFDVNDDFDYYLLNSPEPLNISITRSHNDNDTQTMMNNHHSTPQEDSQHNPPLAYQAAAQPVQSFDQSRSMFHNHRYPRQSYQHGPPPQATPQHYPPPPPSTQANMPQPVQNSSMFYNQHPPQAYQHYAPPPPPTQAAAQPVESLIQNSSMFQAAAQTFPQHRMDPYLAQQAQTFFQPSFSVPQQQPHTSIQHCTCDQCLPCLSFDDVKLLLRGR